MHHFLVSLSQEVTDAKGVLPIKRQEEINLAYKAILTKAELEYPEPELTKDKQATPKKSKLKRLIKHPKGVFRFMTDTFKPFTNNQGERDIRMTKVHQKILGCVSSIMGVEIFSRIRSCISAFQKHVFTVIYALESLLF